MVFNSSLELDGYDHLPEEKKTKSQTLFKKVNGELSPFHGNIAFLLWGVKENLDAL